MGGSPAGAAPDLAVCAAGLRKAYRSRTAVDGLCLEVPRGDVFGLVGPDGAGKTTTFRLLCGILTPDSGSMTVAGRDVVADPEGAKRRIGYLSQAFSQYEDLTVWENLRFAADLYSLPDGEWQDRAGTLLQASRMAPFRDRLAGNLSGGMKQKLALSCTLLHRPEVVFLDEPTTGVDPVSRRDFWSILYDLPREGVTILLSTPYMDEAERCRRLAFMSAGRVLASGTPSALKASLGGDLLVIETDDARAARKALSGLEGVITCALFGNRVHAVVRSASEATPVLRATLANAGLKAGSVERTEAGLEDVFVHLAGAAGLQP